LSRVIDKESESIANKIIVACIRMADISEKHLKKFEEAISYLNEALNYNPSNETAILALANLYIRRNDSSTAQVFLTAALKEFPTNLNAIELMADLFYNSTSFPAALYHYQQVLDSQPDNFEALAKYIEACRRSNKLELVEAIFKKQNINFSKAKLKAGYHYCRGIYYRYSSKLNEALREFVLCKKDSVWAERTLIHMSEIFVNPGNETIGGDALSNTVDNSSSITDLNTKAERLGAITAEKFLNVNQY
jgi:tetratricopeptide (TPR) repeat protein